jgi:hypothetical protein
VHCTSGHVSLSFGHARSDLRHLPSLSSRRTGVVKHTGKCKLLLMPINCCRMLGGHFMHRGAPGGAGMAGFPSYDINTCHVM